jgi:AhpD family alkylhydroperoxidase
MTERIDSATVRAHGGMRAMLELEKAVYGSGIEPSLLDLVKIRASQINGCAFCIEMHTREARARGESEQRIYGLDAWRETPWFSPRERAALAWTEAVTLVADTRVPDAVYDEARARFDEKEIVGLTFAVVAINGWNRLNVSFRRAPGDPRVAHTPARTAVPA